MTAPDPAVHPLLARPAVVRVRNALAEAGLGDPVVALDQTARSAQDAADALEVELGAIVKSLLFLVGGQPVLALVAGDRQCAVDLLPEILELPGSVKRADAERVKSWTGFSIGGVPPFGHDRPTPTTIDASLFRFDEVHAAAGHPHCVFPIAPRQLATLTGATISDRLGR